MPTRAAVPPVVAVLNPKGGSGKTTLAVNVACALQRRGDSGGRRVLIVDTDPQATARDWRAAAGEDAEGVPGVVGVEDAGTLKSELPALASGYDLCMIDGSAKTKGVMGAAVRAADVVLIPVRPSPADLWGVADLVDVVKARQEITGGAPPKAAFVVSQAVTGANLSDDVTGALASYDLPTLEARTGHRVAYAQSMIGGRSVLDGKAGSKAAAEIETITDELTHLLPANP